MAVPAPFIPWLMNREPHALQHFLMTPPAIRFHHRYGSRAQLYHLRLLPQGKDLGMFHPVLRFKSVMMNKIILRHMAIIARGFFSVTGMLPSHILRHHHMAVDARFRRITHIGRGPGNMCHHQPQPGKHPQCRKTRNPPIHRHKFKF